MIIKNIISCVEYAYFYLKSIKKSIWSAAQNLCQHKNCVKKALLPALPKILLNMSLQPLLKKTALSLIFILLVLMVAFSFLPNIIETQITKQMSQKLNLKHFQINIKKLGFFNTSAGDIKSGQSIKIDYIDIDYSLKSLSRHKIDKIQISGLTINVNVNEKFQIELDDFDLSGSDAEQGKFSLKSLPLIPENIEIKNSKILLDMPSQQVIIPFEASSEITRESEKIIIHTAIMPFGETIKVVILLDLKDDRHTISIESKSFDLHHLSEFLKTLTPYITMPAGICLDIKTDIQINKGDLKVHGLLSSKNPFVSPLHLKYNLDLNIQNRLFTLEALTQPTKTMQVSYNNQNISFTKPFFNLAIKGSPLKAKGNWLLKSEKLQDKNSEIKNLAINSDFNYDFTKEGKGLKSTITTAMDQIRLQTDTINAFFQKIKLSSTLLLNKKKLAYINITSDIKNGKIDSFGHKIRLGEIKANLPFSIPNNQSRHITPGKFSIKQCLIDEIYQLKINSDLTRIKSGIAVKGEVLFPDIKNLVVKFNSKCVILPENGINAAFNLHTPPFDFTSKNLAKFIPKKAKGMDFNFNLASMAYFEYSSKGIKSKLNIDVNSGNVKIPDSKFELNKIKTNLVFNDVLSFRSNPAQVLTLASIKLNDIIFNDAVIKYNIESINSLFIENSKVKWCNGIVSSEAFRIPGKDNNYYITLFCDRLELTEILKQMGAFHAEGSGTMSGRIPVTYSKGEISFDNGFLFSTPGQGGKIIIDKADKLLNGIPMNTPQFSELDLAKEALKNYDYKWAKLNFNTQEDTLFVNMQFDGKPSKKILPFEYKKDVARFVRVDASSPGSHFQGIQLDINFKLPFNQVLKFGNKLNKVFK